jgi:drug/metabolite transporter (DMT)-like permease
MSKIRDSYLPFLLLFIQPIFMASNLVVARGGVEYVPPISLAFWRWLLVFFILLPFTFNSLKKNLNFIKKEYKQIFFIGAMGCGVCGAFPFLAGQTTTITNMGIIYTSSPIFIILISSLFFKEKINLLKIIGLCSCLLGVFIIIIKGDLNILVNLKFNIGDLWMLAAAVGWALYSIYLFYWKTNLKIFQRFTLISFFGAVSLFPFYIIEELYLNRTVFNEHFILWVSFAAISPGIIAFTLYTVAQKKLGASITGFTLYIFTVYGAIYGIFIFNEQLENYHYIGTILVFIGVYIVKKKVRYASKT